MESTFASRVPDTCAIVVAGGSGERFGDPRGKQFVPVAGLPMLAWSLLAFDAAPSVGLTVVVCAPERFDEVRDDVLSRLTLDKPVLLAASGAIRQASCLSGLRRVAAEKCGGLVAIHDAARPCVRVDDIERVIARVRDDASVDGAILATRAIDTLKVAPTGIIESTPDRADYWYAQTPQVFRLDVALAAHERAERDGFVGTDDASLVERDGGRVACVDSSRDNIKVTLPEDLAIAEAALAPGHVSGGVAAGGGEAV